jgi:uncharacterized protein
MPNRLAHETSPYLLQHQDNPVDWYPWGEEAFRRAKEEDKPVFLSIGYSSCHWCHVMAHESFEDPDVASLLNGSFINVKVDREERPDIDDAYMTAVQLSSGHGGWPMSLFLTPDRKPFFAGTYFTKEDRGQSPGFKSIVRQLSKSWKLSRTEIQKAADDFAEALRQTLVREAPGTFDSFDEAFLGNVIRSLGATFDQELGGFGDAPKFPPHSAVELLMAYALRPEAPEDLREAALGMALGTLEGMVFGGIHDQVGGGFHRYSTDRLWRLPHFEKMLYDNALMLRNLSRAAAISVEIDTDLAATFERGAAGILEWLDREMLSPEGLYYSAIDADSEGEEGKFYVWTEAETREALGERADKFMEAYLFQPEGNFEDEATREKTGANIPVPDAGKFGLFEEELQMLLEARDERARPQRDDKILVGWNGLVIAGLAEAGQFEKAERAALAILDYEKKLGHLPHQIAGGIPTGFGFLEDYSALGFALFELGAMRAMIDEMSHRQADLPFPTSEWDAGFWFQHAARLTKEMIELFYDEERGGFYASSTQHEVLFGRTKPFFDQPLPSGNAMAMRCLMALGQEEIARKTLQVALGWMQRIPHATEAMTLASLPLLAPTVEKPAEEKRAAVSADVKLSLSPREIEADDEGWGHATLRLEIPEGMHINGHQPPANWLHATKVEVKPLAFKAIYPEGDQHEGSVEIGIDVALPPAEKAGEFEVWVSYQLCTETECLAPKEKAIDGVVIGR